MTQAELSALATLSCYVRNDQDIKISLPVTVFPID